MRLPEQRRQKLSAAVTGADALTDAERLCHLCVDLLHVDGAWISVTHEQLTAGTFGSSGELCRWLDDLQPTFGEGPWCCDGLARPLLQRKPTARQV